MRPEGWRERPLTQGGVAASGGTLRALFPGYTSKGSRIYWHPDTLPKFKQCIRELTNRNRGVSMHYQLLKTSQYICD